MTSTLFYNKHYVCMYICVFVDVPYTHTHIRHICDVCTCMYTGNICCICLFFSLRYFFFNYFIFFLCFLISGGHVTSYYGAEMQKYTSFQVHPDEPVRQIAFLSDGILCLTDTSLRYQLRRGIPKKTHRSKNMLSTHCMLNMGPDRLLIGGHQDQLIDFDLATFTETSTVSF